MKRTLSTLAILAMVGASQAITFTSISASGSGASTVTGSALGSNGETFMMPDFVQIRGAGATTLDLFFTVTATPGYYLTHVDVAPVGSVHKGSASGDTVHSPGAQTHSFNTTWVSGGAQNVTSDPMPLGLDLTGNKTSYTVKSHLELHTDILAFDSFAKITLINFRYEEALVPEPATWLAISAGLALTLKRRR